MSFPHSLALTTLVQAAGSRVPSSSLRKRGPAIVCRLGIGLLALLAFPALTQAQTTTTWTGSVSTAWNHSGNWDNGVPTAASNAVVLSGATITTSGAAGATCLDLTVNIGATLTIAVGFPLEVNRTAVLNGSLAGNGTLRFVGTSTCSVQGTGVLAVSLDIAKAGTTELYSSNLTIEGDLTLQSGRLLLQSGTLSVSGNASLQGGSLGREFCSAGGGVLDVAGDVVVSGTTALSAFCRDHAITIRCAGDWTATSSWAPFQGTVVLDGTGAQFIAGAGPIFPSLTVAAGSSTTAAALPLIQGTLTVNGTLDVTPLGSLHVTQSAVVNGVLTVPDTLDIDLDLTVATSGTLSTGTGEHRIGRSLTVNGAFNVPGTLVFDTDNGAGVSSGAVLPNVRVQKTTDVELYMSTQTVTGDLTLQSGRLLVSGTLSVSGNASLQGGSLGREFCSAGGGVLDVAGDVVVSGTTALSAFCRDHAITIRCAGDWTATSSWAPFQGTVVLDGTGAQFIAGAGPIFPSLTVAVGSSTTAAALPLIQGTLTVNGTLDVTPLGSLHVTQSAVVNGVLTVPDTLDIDFDLTVATSGTLSTGTGEHRIGRSLTVNGAFNVPGTLVFDTDNGAGVSSGAVLPNVRVQKTTDVELYMSTQTVTGDLTLQSGRLLVSGTLSVSGNASLQGGSLGREFCSAGGGVLDVAGDVVVSGTTALSAFCRDHAITIRCAGDWTAASSWAPFQGSVVLDGTGAQLIAGAGPIFPSLTVAAGSSTTAAALPLIQGTLTVNGTLDVTPLGSLHVTQSAVVNGVLTVPDTLDIDLDLTVATSGTLSTGTGEHRIGRSLTVNGAFNVPGTLVFDTDNGAGVSSGAVLPNVRVQKTTDVELYMSTQTVTGDLTLQSGRLLVQSGTLSVSGNASLQGGSLGREFCSAGGGVLDVAGDVVVSGTTALSAFCRDHAITIRCAGDWTAASSWAPFQGTVFLDGTGTTTFSAATPGGTLRFSTLVIQNGTRQAGNDLSLNTSQLTVESSGTLAIAGNTLTLPSGGVTMSGTLSLGAAGTLALGSTINLTIPTGATLSAIGVQGAPATITGTSGSTYGLIVNGTIAASNFLFEKMNASGIVIPSGATIAAAPNDFRGGTLRFGTASPPAGAVLLNVVRSAPTELRYIDFPDPASLSGVFNVKTTAASARITMVNATGDFRGPGYESDPVPSGTAPDGLIHWTEDFTDVTAFVATAGPEEVELEWTTGSEIDVAAFILERGPTATGPFTLVAEIPPAGPSTYQYTDTGLAAGTQVFYRLSERIVGVGNVRQLDSASAVPQFARTRLAFGTAPESPAIASVIWDAFTVRIEDDEGNLALDATQAVTLTQTSGTGFLQGTLTRNAVAGIATFDDLAYTQPELVRFDATSAGLAAITGAEVVVLPFSTDLRVTANDMTFTPAAPTTGQTTLLSALVTNAGQVPTLAGVSFYLGNPDFGGTLISSVSGSVAVGGAATFGVFWTPTTPGLASIFVVVANLTGMDATPLDNRASRVISVDAAPEELQLIAGERIAYPGAELTVPITIRNIGLGSATIVAVDPGTPAWLTPVTSLVGRTLAPGEQLLAQVRLDVPLTAVGAPLGGLPNVQEIPFAVATASDTFEGHVRVKLFDQPASTVTVRVVDDATSAPLAGALVSAQDLPGTSETNGFGEVALNLPPGSRGLFAYKTGFVAGAGMFDIPDGSSLVEIRLQPGQTLEVQQIVSEPLTTQEILDRGITVQDPVNNAVFDFVVALEIGPPLILPNIEVPVAPPAGTVVTFSGTAYVGESGGGGGGGFGTGSLGGGGGVEIVGTFSYHEHGRTETWIIIPGEVTVLKEFFEVTTIVVNNATATNPADVQLRDVSATLFPPSGLALPDLDGFPQLVMQDLGTLDAMQSTQATWIVRGDEAGFYTLSGLVEAELFAFGGFVRALSAGAVSDEFEVTVPRVRCEFVTPDAVTEGEPFLFGVLVTNENFRTANLVRVTLKEEDLQNCFLDTFQPAAVLTFGALSEILSAEVNLGDIEPGQSALAQFQLVSELTGTVIQELVESGCTGDLAHPVDVAADAPLVAAQPQSVTVCVGDSATFTVAASGSQLSYQWRRNGTIDVGADSPTLIIDPVTLADEGSYDVVVSNPGGATASSPALLTVLVAPTITLQPVGQSLCPGAALHLSVTATGSEPFSYQWRRNGQDLAGATAATLDLASVTPADSGTYDVLVANACGTTPSAPALVVVEDVTPPSILCPPDVDVVADPGQCSATGVVLGFPAAADDCALASVTNNAPPSFAVGETFVTWTAFDASGNPASCMQRVTVRDAEPPTIVCPADVDVPAQAGQCGAALSLTAATATDNCSGVSVTSDAPTFFPVGQTTVTWTATDAAGNPASCTQRVTVRDAEPPVITCAADVDVPAQAGQCGAALSLTAATATDNCAGVSVSSDAPAVFPVGDTTVTWTATDAAGNTASCTQQVTVRDAEPPQISCPANIEVPATEAGGAIVDFLVTAQDVCDPTPGLVCSVPSGALFPVGTTTVTCTATDAAGNQASCSFQVTVTATTLCGTCEGTIEVDEDVLLDFNSFPPLYLGDPDLAPFFTFDQTGPTPDTWRATFNLGPRKLLVRSGVSITLALVGQSDVRAPGIDVFSNCALELEAGSFLGVDSPSLDQAGRIYVQIDGPIVVDGSIAELAPGGATGSITLVSLCGGVRTGTSSRIELLGSTPGPRSINISTCDPGADVVLEGVVQARETGAAAAEINVVSFGGSVSIDGTFAQGTDALSGRLFTSGLLVHSLAAGTPGTIHVQALEDVTVLGNCALSSDPALLNHGAVAVKCDAAGTSGGAIDASSLAGGVLLSDRAIDGSNAANTTFVTELLAAGNVELSMDACAGGSANAVLDGSGVNRLRSFAGTIDIGSFVHVAGWENQLTYCSALQVAGTAVLLAAPAIFGPDCSVPAPAALFADCSEFISVGSGGCTRTQGYWKNHPEAWPALSLSLGERSYTQAELLLVLDRPVQGNGLISLAHQLIAARLNQLSGAAIPQEVAVAFTQADALIANLVVPPIGSGYLSPSSSGPYTVVLDDYNNGLAPGGPPHCDEGSSGGGGGSGAAGGGCTLSYGYWKNHPEGWPVTSVRLGVLTYTQGELLAILQQPVRGNGLVSLARQLVAAKLNRSNHALMPATVTNAISNADALIGALVVPPIGNGQLSTGATSSVTNVLDQFNNGILPSGPPSCDE